MSVHHPIDLREFYKDPTAFGLRLAGCLCQVCNRPTDKIVRHADGWLICVECDSCQTCGKRAQECECTL